MGAHEARAATVALALALCLVAVGRAFCADPGPAPGAALGPPVAGPAAPPAVVTQAEELARQGKSREAEELLVGAIQAGKAPGAVFLALGRLFEAGDRKEEALEVYGHLLTQPGAREPVAKERFYRLFYEGRFPRQVRARNLPFSPVVYTADTCRLSPEFHTSQQSARVFVYTTSLLFPEEMTRERPAPWVTLPVGGTPPVSQMINRVAYGLIGDPEKDVLRTRWWVGFPSSTVVASGSDHSLLAQRILHVLLRANVYVQEYLALDRTPDPDGLFRAYLTELGPTGAAQRGDCVFFFDVNKPREPLEWIREVFHEAGHLFLPQAGPFDGEEKWANGDMGERLFFQYLLEEAGAVAGQPWPSEAAKAALDKVWEPCQAEARRYLIEHCRVPVTAWLSTDPESFAGRDGCERFAAFCLWAQAAHGRALLASVLHNPGGTAPANFLARYKSVVADTLSRGLPLWVDAGSLNPIASKLSQPQREGAVRSEMVTMSQGGFVTLRAYLPAGRWLVTPGADREAKTRLSLKLDAAKPLDTDANQPVDLGALPEGWHDIVVTCLTPGPVEFIGLKFAAQAAAAPRPPGGPSVP